MRTPAGAAWRQHRNGPRPLHTAGHAGSAPPEAASGGRWQQLRPSFLLGTPPDPWGTAITHMPLGRGLTRPGPEGPGDVAGLRGDRALPATGGPSQRDRQGKGARGTAAAPLLPTPACSGAEPAARLLAMGMAQHHGVGGHLSVCVCPPRDAQLETALSPQGASPRDRPGSGGDTAGGGQAGCGSGRPAPQPFSGGTRGAGAAGDTSHHLARPCPLQPPTASRPPPVRVAAPSGAAVSGLREEALRVPGARIQAPRGPGSEAPASLWSTALRSSTNT